MAQNPLVVQRQPLLNGDQLARIGEATLDLLAQAGIAVLDEGLRQRVRALGYREKDDRVLIDRRQVAEFLAVERRRTTDHSAEDHTQLDVPDPEIRVWLNNYPPNVHDIETDAIVPFTTDRLIEATKLVDVLADRGLIGSPPGCPTDVPPHLQSIVQYWVGAAYSRQGRWPPDVRSVEDCPYIMEMADVLGNPIRQLKMWVASPLTLGGDSLAYVTAFAHKVSSVHVGSMPTAGCTAPMHAGDALALAAAEVIGAAILLQDVLNLPVYWTAGIWPVDFVSMALVVGSPEHVLYDLMGSEVNAYLHGTPWQPACTCFHTMAKLPGPQSCAEKASSMTMGALLGARRFGVAGTLSLDEVFSAEQLLYDLEIRDHVQRLVGGMDGDCDPARCLTDVLEGVKERSFVGLDTTLDSFRSLCWRPTLFERDVLARWTTQGARTIRQKTRAAISDLLGRHEYELEGEVQAELDSILARARTALS